MVLVFFDAFLIYITLFQIRILNINIFPENLLFYWLYLWVTPTSSIIDTVGFESPNPTFLATNFDHNFVIKCEAMISEFCKLHLVSNSKGLILEL